MEGFDWRDSGNLFSSMAAQGMPRPETYQPEDVRREAKSYSTQLLADHRLLRGIVERHEATIQKRWTKKTQTQKSAILLAAWPNMPKVHRPDFAASHKRAAQTHSQATDVRGSYIWPYINQEDLLRSKALLLLLNSRARNHPSVFAAADNDAMHFGFANAAIIPVFLNEHICMLNGITEDAEYGRIMNWDNHRDAFEWMVSEKQFNPGEGLLVLEAQARVLAFLVACCRSILHEIADKDLCNDDIYPIQPEPTPKDPAAITAGIKASLAVMAEEAPYRVPALLDLPRIEALLAAQRDAAEAHVLALREDPGYFTDHIMEVQDHRQEMLKDLAGNIHPNIHPARRHTLWNYVMRAAMTRAHMAYEMYSDLTERAKQLRALQREYADQISPLKDLPESYLRTMLKFEHYLNQRVKVIAEMLKVAFVASPPMRSIFVREVPISLDSTKIFTIERPGVKVDTATRQLIFYMNVLFSDTTTLEKFRLYGVTDELDRLMKTGSRERDLVSSYIAGMIGELSILGECLRQLGMYQPWANGFQNALASRGEKIQKEFYEEVKPQFRVMESMQSEKLSSMWAYGVPTDGKFNYPVGKHRSKAVCETLRSAERNLDIFWEKLDNLVRTRAGDQNGSAMKRLLEQPRLLQRTPEWIEPPKATKPTTASADTLASSLAATHLHSQTPSARKEVLATAAAKSAKTKAKTRGKARVAVPDADSEATQADNQAPTIDTQPSIEVDARALKVFRILFFDPEANTTPGEVAWLDFLHAMQATGFVAQKLYGSVWHFQPMTLDVERSIQFHEPHPRGKLPFVTARRYGRRLNRAYGWHAETFVLKEKAAA